MRYRLLFCLITILALSASAPSAAAKRGTKRSTSTAAIPARPSPEQVTRELESYLLKHPEDQEKREQALRWYGYWHQDIRMLKHHTFEMIKYHPDDNYIMWDNARAFRLDRAYGLEVISKLEEKVANGASNRELHWIIGHIAQDLAFPPDFKRPEDRKSFLDYYGLPATTVLPSSIDHDLAEKAIQHFRQAIKAAHWGSFYTAFYASQLADIYLDLDQPDDAVKTCQAALLFVGDVERCDFYTTYGTSLRKAHRAAEAKMVLSRVRKYDTEGFGHGPGHATTHAETELGLIAFDEGDINLAAHYLISSCRVQRCCHNSCQGLPVSLARKLLDAGRFDAVIRYCHAALGSFQPCDDRMKSLLEEARIAKSRSR